MQISVNKKAMEKNIFFLTSLNFHSEDQRET